KIDNLQNEYEAAKAKYDDVKMQQEALLRQRDDLERPKKLAEARLKKLLEDYDIQLKVALKKHWYFNDRFRSLPVLDAFNSPLRIQQFTLNELPIDYNFKYVTRFDRCTTCHLGIDRPDYDKAALRNLAKSPTSQKLRETRALIKQLKEKGDEAELKRQRA